MRLPSEGMTMRVVSYIRMSTGRQETSPAQQRAAIQAHAAKHGYTIAAEYADLGITGDSVNKRPEFKRMIAEAAANQFDRIVAYDRSRFGRFDSIDFGQIVAPLREAGIDLEFLDSGIEDWSDFGGRVIALVGQEGKHEFLRDLSRAAIRGKLAKVAAGHGYCGPTPYGYDRHTKIEDRSRISELTLDATTAAIVRDIFAEYAKPGGSICGVAAALNRRGVPTARGAKNWRPNAVQRILVNEVYVGDAVWGRRQKGRYYARQGTEVVPRKRGSKCTYVEPIRHRDAVPPIVSRELFATVQKLLAERTKLTRSAAATRPLSGLVLCAQCGRVMHADGPNQLRCQTSSPALPEPERCPSVRVPTAPLAEAVVSGLRDRLATPAARARLQTAMIRRAEARAGSPDADAREALRTRHRQLEKEVAAGLERIPSMPAGLVADYAATLERKAMERDRVAAELAAVPDVRPAAPHLAVAKALESLDRLVAAAMTATSPAAVNGALRALNVSVRVTPSRRPLEAHISVGDLSTVG
jgi:DNA invertase Pin-like site-specific DNA recombinase